MTTTFVSPWSARWQPAAEKAAMISDAAAQARRKTGNRMYAV